MKKLKQLATEVLKSFSLTNLDQGPHFPGYKQHEIIT